MRIRWKTFATLGLLAPLSGGCNVYYYSARNLLNEPVEVGNQVCRRHDLRSEARATWKEVVGQYPRCLFTEEFRDGFVDGYSDYLDRGGNAQPPAVPPKKYTRNKYMTPEGHALVRDYFLGFQYGVQVAVSTGRRQYLTVPVLVAEKSNAAPTFNIIRPPTGGTPGAEPLPPPKAAPSTVIGPPPAAGPTAPTPMPPAPMPPAPMPSAPMSSRPAPSRPAATEPASVPVSTPAYEPLPEGASKFDRPGGPPAGPTTPRPEEVVDVSTTDLLPAPPVPVPTALPTAPAAAPLWGGEPASKFDRPWAAEPPAAAGGVDPIGFAGPPVIPPPPPEVERVPEGQPTPSILDDLPVRPPVHPVMPGR